MKHLIPLTPDQISLIESSLRASTKYSDAQHIEDVQNIIKVIEGNQTYTCIVIEDNS